ncbi:MAG: hypothetical protein ACHQZS_07970 [Candidatus Binatales bacterium]
MPAQPESLLSTLQNVTGMLRQLASAMSGIRRLGGDVGKLADALDEIQRRLARIEMTLEDTNRRQSVVEEHLQRLLVIEAKVGELQERVGLRAKK